MVEAASHSKAQSGRVGECKVGAQEGWCVSILERRAVGRPEGHSAPAYGHFVLGASILSVLQRIQSSFLVLSHVGWKEWQKMYTTSRLFFTFGCSEPYIHIIGRSFLIRKIHPGPGSSFILFSGEDIRSHC